MELYIIRHGDPDYANDTLTEKGWKEAEALAPRLLRIQPTDLYASPLGRAQDTARPSCKALGMEFTVENWMVESMDYMKRGALNDPTQTDAGYTVTFADGPTLRKDFAPERAATVEQMIRDSDAFLARHGYVREGYRYRAVEDNERKVCCFCHGGFGSAWVAHLLGMYPVFNWHQFALRTTSVTHFRFRADESGYAVPNAVCIGDVSHLWGTGL